MSRATRKYNERLRNYYGSRDESGNGECFAGTYRQTMGMSAIAVAPSAPAAPAPKLTPLQASIAACEAQIASYETKTFLDAGDKDQLGFYRGLLASKRREQAALDAE